MSIERDINQNKSFEQVLQDALSDGVINNYEVIDIVSEFEQEKSKLDFTKESKELFVDIENLFKDVRDELGELKKLVSGVYFAPELRDVLGYKKKYAYDYNSLHEYIDSISIKDKDNFYKDYFAFEEIYNSYEYSYDFLTKIYTMEMDKNLDEYFMAIFEKGIIFSDIGVFDLENDIAWCKEKGISPEKFAELAVLLRKKNCSWFDFRHFHDSNYSLYPDLDLTEEAIFFLDNLTISIMPWFDKISNILAFGDSSKKIMSSGYDLDKIIHGYALGYFSYEDFLKYGKLFFAGGAMEVDRFYELSKQFSGSLDVDGNKIMDSFCDYLNMQAGGGVDLEIYPDSGRKVFISTENYKSVQFFIGILQFLDSHRNLGSDSDLNYLFVDGKFDSSRRDDVIQSYQDSLKEFVDSGAEYSPDKIFWLVGSQKFGEDYNGVFARHNQIKKVFGKMYGKTKIVDLSSDKQKDILSPQEILYQVENLLKKGKKVMFFLGLHGGEDGSAGYAGGDFGRLEFDKLQYWQTKYVDKDGKSLLTLDYDSCNSGYKADYKYGGKTYLTSGYHPSSSGIAKLFLEGADSMYLEKFDTEGLDWILNQRIFRDYLKGLLTKHKEGFITIGDFDKLPGSLFISLIEDNGEILTEGIFFNNFDDLIHQLEKYENKKFVNEFLYDDLGKEKKIVMGESDIQNVKTLIDVLKKLKTSPKKKANLADYNGDGKVSREEIHLYQMESYDYSIMPTIFQNKKGNVIRISGLDDKNLFANKV